MKGGKEGRWKNTGNQEGLREGMVYGRTDGQEDHGFKVLSE